MNNYIAITQDTLLENTKIGCDLYLKSYVNGTARYVLFCHGDEIFGNDRKEELVEQSIKKLFICEKDFKRYFKYQENNLKNVLTDKNKSSREKSRVVYHVAKHLATDLLSDPRSGNNLRRATRWVDNTINYILNDKNAFLTLVKVTSHDYYTYTHSVNLAVLGLLFGKYLSLATYDLNCLGVGMLLHDIGKIEIPLEILNKPGKLTEDEFEEVKKHPKIGLRLLHDRKIEENCLRIIIQHHENYDGSGYPNRIGAKDIHLFGKISRLIDVYDAMTTNRPYAKAIRPFAALMEMRENMPNCFEKELLKEFIRFLGPIDPRRKRRKRNKLTKI